MFGRASKAEPAAQPAAAPAESCGNCAFYTAKGECRRYAPRSMLTSGGALRATDNVNVPSYFLVPEQTSPRASWPFVSSADWCGDWSKGPR